MVFSSDRYMKNKVNEKVYLMILDGFGIGKKYPGNAIEKAFMPTYHNLLKEFSSTKLKAAGNEVGLPGGIMGNSEVGHFTIGAGRITFQSLESINQSIKNGSFFKNKVLLKAIEKAGKNNSTIHLLGMISDEGVHAHINHLFALIDLAVKHKINNIYIHAITDGRDVAERSASKYIQQIQKKISTLKKNNIKIATIIGRYYAMDRDHNWDRTIEAYKLLTAGIGTLEQDPLNAIANAYKRGIETDYYIKPILLDQNGLIKNGDNVIFFNFRTDRPRQLTNLFTGEERKILTDPKYKPQKTVNPNLTCFGEYSKKAHIVFETTAIKNNLPQTLEKAGKKQLHIAETEKFAHVTFFFNSQSETQYPHETRLMIDSPKVKSYDQKPEMSAKKITTAVVKEIASKKYDVIIQNFANADLVGHSGDFKATVKALEVIDACIKKITEQTLKHGYHLIITADHGNAEYMIYEKTGEQCPAHTTNPVPFILVSKTYRNVKLRRGLGLSDIAPTILKLLGVKQPKEMTGTSIIPIKK